MKADEDLLALEQLEEEEIQLVAAKARALEAALVQSSREAERCLEAVRRALPELDLVSKTAGELRQSIHKTMERADVVSVKVRELDLSRSRALEALEYAKKCVEARTFVRMARQALADREVEVAAGYVQRFDELAANATTSSKAKREQFGEAGEEMLQIRNELERSILFAKDNTGSTHQQSSSPAQHSLQAIADNWLESSAIKEALKHANVMSKVASEDSSAEIRYAHFLASFLKDRMQGYLAKQHAALAQDDKAYIEAFKFLFNSSCALIQSQLAMRILSKRAKPHIFKHIHAECDKQCTQLFDSFMTARKVHERAAGQTGDLQKLNHLLTEICIIMQHVESYDRFTRSLDLPEPPTTYVQPEYKRVIQEVAGAYTMLERNWLTESLKRAKQAEQVVEITTTGNGAEDNGAVLQVSSLVEDAFYLCKRAVKRGLGTGSADAACGCINQIAGCLEDALSFTPQQQQQNGDTIQVNSLEISSQYCLELNQQILHSMQRTFERPDELAKTKGCAEALVDLAVKLQRTRVTVLQQLLQPTFAMWESAAFTDVLKRATYDNTDENSTNSSEFVERWVAQMPPLQQRFGMEMSEQSFQLCVELVAQRVAEDVEKGIVTKDFTQLGALQFEHDLREIIESIAQISVNSFTVRAMFTRLLQITSLLAISTLGEAHDVWDSFSAQKPPSGMAVKPRERLTSNLAKRILTRRTDFRQKDVDRLKLL